MFSQYTRQLNYLDLIIKNGKVPHAFLFHGRNIELQTSVAKAIIFLVNNPSAKWDDFENDSSETALTIKNESHPDVFLVRREEDKKNIGIEQIRKLKGFVSQSPFNFETKAAIIAGAESLSEESWDALLKTLEEPAGRTLIFMVSRGLKDIPKTVLSRALIIPFVDSSGVSNTWLKDDIILKKLAGIDALGVAERLGLAETVSALENKSEILDNWLLILRDGLMNGKIELSTRVEAIAQTKKTLSETNANPRLVLENLFIKI